MNHPLRVQVKRVARRARLLLVVRGMALFLAISFVVALISGALDYGIRLQDIGLRSLITIAAAAVCIWSFAHYLWPALRYRTDEVSTARWIERCRPELRDELSSAIAFLGTSNGDITAGSPNLRGKHIQRVAARLAEKPIAGCLRLSYSLRPLALSA